MERRSLGARGEEIAEKYLRKSGYRILGRNWSVLGPSGKMLGELDIVAQNKSGIVFAEVKAGTSSNGSWRPELHVTPGKILRLKRAAQVWLSSHRKLEKPWRIDVLAIDFSAEDTPRLRHFKNVL